MDTVNDSEVEAAPPVLSETESASPTSERPPNQLKLDALRRLKALERRDKTVGTHLDELRALLKVLFELMPD
jgi:hypothetical protein